MDMAETKIEWCTTVWNPITGCDKVSAGCDNCYAKRMIPRLQKNPRTAHKYRNGFKVTCHPEELEKPLHWRKPRMVFVPSMGDLFHKDVPFDFMYYTWSRMELCKQHIFIVLTKRPKRMAQFLVNREIPPHIWVGVSVENQKTADERIPILLQVLAAVIVVSYEPAIGSLILPPEFLERGKRAWCIVGGETGPGARPMNPDWVRKVQRQCVEAGVPFFLKQNGLWIPVDTVGDDPDPEGRSAMAYKDGTVDQNWQPGSKCLGAQVLWRVTKKQAGRLLDGRVWDQTPVEKWPQYELKR